MVQPRPLAMPRPLPGPAPAVPSRTQPFRISGDGQPVAVLGEVVAEPPLDAGASPGSGCSPRSTGEVTRISCSSLTCRSIWQPTPQYGQTDARSRCRACRTASAPNRSRGMTSKIAPVGQTRTHSPHQVQPAWSGSPSPPTMISVCVAALRHVEHADLLDVRRRPARSGCRGCRASCRAGSSRRRGARRRREGRVGCSVGAARRSATRTPRTRSRAGACAVPGEVLDAGSARAASRARPAVVHRRRRSPISTDHAVGGRRGAGGRQLALALDGHQADAAVADGGELRDTSRGWGCRRRRRARRPGWSRPTRRKRSVR